jgi:hypothetical protein
MFLLSLFVVNNVLGQSETKALANEYNIRFEYNKYIINEDHSNNGIELIKVNQFIKVKLDSIKRGELIVFLKSKIYEDQKSEMFAINRSAVLASVVRAFLKTRFNLGNENFKFGIELSSKGTDNVSISLIPADSLNNSLSSDIYYSLSTSKRNIVDQLSKYSMLPFIYNEKVTDKKIKDKDIPKINFYFVNSIEYRSNSYINYHSTKSIDKKSQIFKPVIGINTNIFKWIGISHQWQDQVVVPNIELEYLFGSRSAIKLSGELRSSEIFSNNSITKWSYQSGISLGYKLFYGEKERFKGLYSSLFVSYRDFDNFNKEKSDNGVTGDALDLGVEIGYNFRITNHIGIITGVSSCFTHESSSKYIINNQEYFLASKLVENKLGNSKYFVMLQLRFGK